MLREEKLPEISAGITSPSILGLIADDYSHRWKYYVLYTCCRFGMKKDEPNPEATPNNKATTALKGILLLGPSS